ncbi:MAG: nucleotidyltransferase domain-containing protein [Candidatus Tectomicrobia bacterium]|nr:nucleotidyltransferase domain-containing protein [Candidatus Tectomicrobia bacterium]
MTNPTAEQDAILEEIVRRLVEVFAPERIYLFGSKARGDAGADSDFDIMVVVASSPDPPHRRSQQGYLALRGIGAAVDVQVWTREAFDGRLHLKASFPSTVVREGKLLYGA